MSEFAPEQILQQLKKQASSRVQTSLDATYQICNEQLQRNLTDFSYATVARLGKGKGVPAAQSIRNITGKPYQTLIASFVAISPKPEKVSNNPQKGITYAWINSLEDPLIKLQANILYSQKKEAERLLKEVVPINQVIEIYDGSSSHSMQSRLTDLERDALQYLISNEFLRRYHLEKGINGSILKSDTNDAFFPVATIDAIKKALEYL